MIRYPNFVTDPAFCRAVKMTLDEEGVFSDHSWDPGGATKYGITSKVALRHGFDVRNLTVSQAVGIYWIDYWVAPGLGKIDSWHVAGELFDTQVNTGRSAIVAQRALVYNLFTTEQAIGGIDGRWGPKTRAAINETTRRYERHLMAALAGELYKHYHAIKPHRPELFQRAIRGWMKRVHPDLKGIDRAAWHRRLADSKELPD